MNNSRIMNLFSDFQIDQRGVLRKYLGSANHITLPSDVEVIAGSVFKNNTYLKEITIQNGVRFISSGAFFGCISLTKVRVPNTVRDISKMAFFQCDSLVEMTIPDSIESIGIDAFRGCYSLENISLPSHFTNKQILKLGLPCRCVIERRELVILPMPVGFFTTYKDNIMQSENRIDQLALRALILAKSYAAVMFERGLFPFLPDYIWLKVLKHHRKVYIPASTIMNIRSSLNVCDEKHINAIEEYHNDCLKLESFKDKS